MELGYGQDRTQRLIREKAQDRWMDAYAPVRDLVPVLVGVAGRRYVPRKEMGTGDTARRYLSPS